MLQESTVETTRSDSMPSSVPSAAGLIRILGAFSTEFRDQPLPPGLWRRAHARRLVQLLGSAPRMTESRAKVLAALWPDFEEQRARNRLHHTVHWIRQGFDELPLSFRPQITVGPERVELQLPPSVALDAQLFLAAIEADSPDDASRLADVERAIAWYRDDLAPDWQGMPEIDARRAWFAGLFDAALAEAVQLATDLEHADLAIQHAQRRASRPGASVEAHCIYASLLADQGRPDSAVLHCHSLREAFKEEGADALRPLDDLVRDIQQRANRALSPLSQPNPAVIDVDRASSALPPQRPLFGFERLVEAGLRTLADPYVLLLALVGPPGAGKSALAVELVHRALGGFRHGALWVDCQTVRSDEIGLLLAVAGAVAPRDCFDPSIEGITRALHGRELLIVLDGLEAGDELGSTRALAAWQAANRDVRWLVTARLPIKLRGGKNLVVEPTELLESADPAAALPAAQLVARSGSHGWTLQDKRVRTAVEAIAMAVDALPCLLEAAGAVLETMWPNELLSRLDRDPAALLRGCSNSKGAADRRLNCAALVDWVNAASPEVRRLLAVAGRCSTWLARDDLSALCDDEPGAVHGLVEQAVRHHLMFRRVKQTHEGAWSEFRVPRYVAASLSLGPDPIDVSLSQARIAAWLKGGPTVTEGPPASDARAASWFDDHIDDFETLVREWQLAGRHADLAALCASQRRGWSGSRHVARVLEWLASLGEHMDHVPDALAAGLFLDRARLRAQLGQLHGAFEDASRAMARAGALGDTGLRQAALALVERFGASHCTNARQGAIDEKGIEAGESLLRVAQLTLRHGELVKALQLSGEAIGVFNYFGLTRGLLKGQQLRAKIAFALGDTALAQQCIVHVERAARTLSDHAEAGRAELLRAAVLMAEMQFQRAIEITSSLMAKPDMVRQPALTIRALLLLGWAHYAIGAWPVARAFATELRDQARLSANMGTRLSVETLSALLEARQGARASAVRRVGALLDMPVRDRVIPDLQGDCVNAADLLLHLGRPDLAARALDHLSDFSRRPDHRLRLWVGDRAHDLRSALSPESQPVAAGAVDPGAAGMYSGSIEDLLESLVRG